jgi:hypothetical protein
MGITVSAVTSRLHRARVFLRDRIGRHLNVTDAELWRKLDGRLDGSRRFESTAA